MAVLDGIVATIAHTRNQTLKLVADLSDEQLVKQPASKVNHPAWVLGHLIVVDYAFLTVLHGGRPQVPAWVDDALRATYGAKSEPVADPAKYQKKEWYLERLAIAHEQVLAKLRSLSPADLDAPHPDPARRERFPTLGHVVPFYGIWHESYHAGQLSTWRRAQGLPAV
jgi:uncharacterized damage-inducible protein DinB